MKLKYKCKICKEIFDDKKELYSHKIKVHNILNNGGQQPKYDLSCKFCGVLKHTTKSTMINHEKHCELNPDKIPYKKYIMSEKGRKNISKGMIKAHKEGRASSWIGRRQRSYAEQSWFNIFTNKNITFKNNYYVKPYWLDFAWPEKKIYFEVDGRTHYTEEGKLYDNKRTQNLSSEGWTLICRCNWSEYQKLSTEEKQKYVEKIIDFITNAPLTQLAE